MTLRGVTLRGGCGASFTEMAASAGDGKAFVVKEVLDVANSLHIFVTVEAMALGTLHRLEHGKFGFPVTQHERLRVGEAANLADAEKTACGGGVLAGVFVYVRAVFVHCSSVTRARSTARTRILARFRGVSTLAPPAALAFAGGLVGAGALFHFNGALAGVTAAFADALDEADGRAGKVELLAEAVFQEALVAEVQLIALVGKQDEGGGRGCGLRA